MKSACMLAEAHSCRAHQPVVDWALVQGPGRQMTERLVGEERGGRGRGQLTAYRLSEVTMVKGSLGALGSVPLVSDSIDSNGSMLALFSTKSWKSSKGALVDLCPFPCHEQPLLPRPREHVTHTLGSSVVFRSRTLSLMTRMFKGCSHVCWWFVLGFLLCPTLPAG